MKNLLLYMEKELDQLYPKTEIKSFYHLIVENLTGFSRSEIILNKNTVFSDQQQHLLHAIIVRLQKFEPIQYILGETEFYGLNLLVNSSVLIPRPETEELVDWIKMDNPKYEPLSILDIGTGSGCIAITLKSLFPNAQLSAFDISDRALITATENAKRNNQNVNFQMLDILTIDTSTTQWDIIVSNPPYIPKQEMIQISPNVLQHEPHLALFVPDQDPLIFYRAIARYAQNCLRPNGKLYFEIHRDAGASCVELFVQMGFKNIELRKDISRNDRMIKAEF